MTEQWGLMAEEKRILRQQSHCGQWTEEEGQEAFARAALRKVAEKLKSKMIKPKGIETWGESLTMDAPNSNYIIRGDWIAFPELEIIALLQEAGLEVKE